ncbi:hypothetical protein Tco_0104618 [Tanacetum coccineum]
MSQPANDEFSQHLSDDEASNHEDASDTGIAPKQQQQVIQNGNSKKITSTGNDGVIRILPPVTATEIQAVEKERKAKNILLMAIPKEHMRRFHGMDDAKEIWEAIRTRFEDSLETVYTSKLIKTNDFKGVPHPLSGDYTPKPQEEIDESLYVYGKKGPQEPEPNVSDDRSSEYLDSQYLPGPQTVFVLKDHREIGELLLRPQQVIIGDPLDQTPIVMDHPLKNMVDRGIFDSGCSGHMTGNKDQLEDFKEFW